MNLTEKVAYLKGLVEGLDIGNETKEAKILTVLIDLVDDMAFALSEMEDQMDEVVEQIDSVDEDLYTLEEAFSDYLDDEYDCECGCGHDDDEEIDGDIYEVICAKCGEPIYLDESIIEQGSIDCPHCGELLEFELDDDDDDEDEEDDD